MTLNQISPQPAGASNARKGAKLEGGDDEPSARRSNRNTHGDQLPNEKTSSLLSLRYFTPEVEGRVVVWNVREARSGPFGWLQPPAGQEDKLSPRSWRSRDNLPLRDHLEIQGFRGVYRRTPSRGLAGGFVRSEGAISRRDRRHRKHDRSARLP